MTGCASTVRGAHVQAGVGVLRTTNKGRIWSYNNPSLGATANAAFLAVGYATLLKPQGDKKARTYTCWAQQQVGGGCPGQELSAIWVELPAHYCQAKHIAT